MESKTVQIEEKDNSRCKIRVTNSLTDDLEEAVIYEQMTESGTVSISTEGRLFARGSTFRTRTSAQNFAPPGKSPVNWTGGSLPY